MECYEKHVSRNMAEFSPELSVTEQVGYSIVQHAISIKCCLLFLQALFHMIPLIPICSFDLTAVVNICESVPLDRSSMHGTFVYFIISSCSL